MALPDLRAQVPRLVVRASQVLVGHQDEAGVVKPLLVDLFCGAGGASMGYSRAGFDVIGVDLNPQPHYPFEFVQMDAMRWLADVSALLGPGDTYMGREIMVIHASPPCQAFTQMSAKHRGKGGLADQRVNLLTPTLELLRPMDIPWVVENVQGSVPPLRPILKLHGGMFGLGVHRPRLFESNVMLLAPRMPECKEPVGVYGNAPDSRALWVRKNPRFRNNGNWRTAVNPKKSVLRAPSNLAQAQEAMGMDWADWHGTKEAIPPAYTEFIGTQLLQHLGVTA